MKRIVFVLLMGIAAIATAQDYKYYINIHTGQWDLAIDTGTVAGSSDTSLWEESGHYLYPKILTDSVGIGTATPSSRFEVKDLIKFLTDHNNSFFGLYGGSSITNGHDNTFLGSRTGLLTTIGNHNTFIGSSSGNTNVSGNYNTYLGSNSGGLSTGSYNVFLGYQAGYNETGSNKLYIENSNSSSPLIYGEFDNDLLKCNGHFSVTDSLNINGSAYVDSIVGTEEMTGNVANSTTRLDTVFSDVFNGDIFYSDSVFISDDSIRYVQPVCKYHRVDSMNIGTANTWLDVKLDTNIADETTYGFSLNSDSTGIVINQKGIYEVGGCIHWKYYGLATTRVKIFTRILIDGCEARCLQTNTDRDRRDSGNGYQNFAGTIVAKAGSVVKLQVQVDDTDLDLEGSSVFDHPVAATLWLEYQSNK